MLTGWQWVIVIGLTLSISGALVFTGHLDPGVFGPLAGAVVTLFAKPHTKGDS